MKKFCIFLILFLFCFSCSTVNEKKLLGNWKLSNAEFDNLENFANVVSENYLKEISYQIDMASQEVARQDDEDKKAILQKKVDELNQLKEKYTPKIIINDVKSNYESLKDNLKMIFNEDNTFRFVNQDELTEGKFKIVGDSLFTTVDNETINVFIKSLDETEIVIESPLDYDCKVIMTFVKE